MKKMAFKIFKKYAFSILCNYISNVPMGKEENE